ncbi:MATE family efflux transporter [Chachezhania sediminis]|uniref:MATE family efflux transporter n=1 Tax=Chachezhania sediminis TaxID=2599291 RepID=UPI00131D25DC|nr:MATE family efflux transporter [Chachezhania sediminis]
MNRALNHPPKGAAAPNAAANAPRTGAAVRSAARTKLLLDGPIGPTLARLAFPNVLSMLVMAIYSISEAYFAGRLGVEALAGLALVYPLAMFTQMLSGGSFGGSMAAAVARALGRGDTTAAARLVFAAWGIAIGVAVLSAVLMAVLGAPIFRLLGGQGGALDAALGYAAIYFPLCIAIWLANASFSLMRGTGDMLTPSLVLTAVCAVSVPLSGALSLGWGPFPGLGIAGLALGQTSAFGVGALFSVLYVLSGRTGLNLAGALRGVTRAHVREILRVGLMASLSPVQTVLTVVVMVGLVGRFGAEALAGYGLGARLEFLMVPVAFGIGTAMTAMVGANIGAGHRARALRIAWTGTFGAAAIVGAIGLLVALMPDLWLGLFLDPAASGAWKAGRAYLHIVGPVYAFFALGLALYFASQGAGHVAWPVIAGFARLIVAFGGAALLVATTSMGVTGIFAAIAAGMLTYGVITAVAVRLTGWR